MIAFAARDGAVKAMGVFVFDFVRLSECMTAEVNDPATNSQRKLDKS